MISTILSSSSPIHSSATFILLLIPSSVFFISVIVLFISVCSLELLVLCYTFLVSSRSVPPFFFWNLGSSLLSLLWIIFQVDCLSPLHLVVLPGFYLVPSSEAYSSAISLCLIFCDCSFCSTGFKVLVLLVSAVCLLVDEAGLRGLCRLPGGRDSSFTLVGAAGSCPSGEQGHVNGCV